MPKDVTFDWQDKPASAAAMDKFSKMFAKKYGQPLIQSSVVNPYETIPTGSMALDRALIVGGYPRGRLVQLWGNEQAGKSSMAMINIAAAQRAFPDKLCSLVDQEHTFDEAWAVALGVDLSRLIRSEKAPDTAEEGIEMYRDFVESGLCSLAVFDSVGAMASKKEFEKMAEEDVVATVARVVSRGTRELIPAADSTRTTMLIINQARANIGTYGGTTTTTGGFTLQHMSSIKGKVATGERLYITRDGKQVPVGQEIKVKIEKNKLGPYGATATMVLLNQATDQYGPVGLDRGFEAMQFGTELGVIVPDKGSWWVMPDGARVNGRAKVTEYLREHPAMIEDVRAKLLETIADQIGERSDDEAEALEAV